MKNRGKFIEFLVIIPALLQILGAAPDVYAVEVSLPEGTQITLQLNDTLSTASNMEGDVFTAMVASPVYLGGSIVIPKGSIVTGSVSRIIRPDRLKGKAILDLMFQSIRIPGRRQAGITAALVRIDHAGSGEAQSPDAFREREKSAAGTAKSGNPGRPKINIRANPAADGKNIGSGASGGLPSVFNLQGVDLEIPRGASMEIMLGRQFTLPEEIEKPARK